MGGMGMALLVVGLMLAVTVVKGNTAQVASQLNSDLTGSGSFLLWIGALVFLAVAGNVLNMPRATKMFMGLILAVFVLQQQGLWAQFSSAFSNLSAPAASTTAAVGQTVTASGQPAAVASTPAASATPPPATAASPFASIVSGVLPWGTPAPITTGETSGTGSST